MSGTRATKWGTWRGASSDVTPTFPEWQTWSELENSTWHIDTYRGFEGRLLYGLPLLPRGADASRLRDVADGKHDATFRKVARGLRTRDRGDSIVRVDWEANGTWMSYSVTSRTAADYRDAFARVASVMRKEAPDLLFSFDVNCGSMLKGQGSRLDSLTKIYPGDDAVDLVGCSMYDWSVLGATTPQQWRLAIRPPKAVGLADIAAFARAHGKGMSVPEWGLAPPSQEGNGDNPFFIRAMHEFFVANDDVLAVESYFNEGGTDQRSSLWPQKPQNPKAAAEYHRLWGAASTR